MKVNELQSLVTGLQEENGQQMILIDLQQEEIESQQIQIGGQQIQINGLELENDV